MNTDIRDPFVSTPEGVAEINEILSKRHEFLSMTRFARKLPGEDLPDGKVLSGAHSKDPEEYSD